MPYVKYRDKKPATNPMISALLTDFFNPLLFASCTDTVKLLEA
jgi:hypothetical protein